MEVKAGQIYKHFKGNTYRVVAIAKSCEDLSLQVVYQDTEDEHKIWVRSYEEFISPVDKEKYPNINQEYRFTLVN